METGYEIAAAEALQLAEWIDRKVVQGRGAVQFGYTENGDIGVWIGKVEGDCLGCGDTAAEAVSTAIRLSKEAIVK